MGKVLSDELQKYGFRCVHGSDEIVGGDTVKRIQVGIPSTWSRNNGVIAVYDEQGFAWVAPQGDHFIGDTIQMLHEGLIAPGPYVPHSNDGGDAIRRMFPMYPLRKTLRNI